MYLNIVPVEIYFEETNAAVYSTETELRERQVEITGRLGTYVVQVYSRTKDFNSWLWLKDVSLF